MATAKQMKQLDKIFALYNDPAAQETQESQAAYDKLKDLCSKFKVDFDEYVKSKGFKDADDFAKQCQAIRERGVANRAEVFKNRRRFVFEMVRHNVWDRNSLVEACDIFFPDFTNKSNKTAVGGCLNHMQNGYHADIRTCEADGRIRVSGYKPKKVHATL